MDTTTQENISSHLSQYANTDNNDDYDDNGFKYLIVRPEECGIRDLFKYWVWADEESSSKFLKGSEEGVVGGAVTADRRWVIVVSIIVRKIIALFRKPLEWTGFFVDFILNLLSSNGNLFSLLYNLLHGEVVMPKRGTETFISTIGHLDGRIDLYKGERLLEGISDSVSGVRSFKLELGNRALMDLCIMAAKLAYENNQVVQNIVLHHWKMHFVDFYDCWNDFQKERSTQVFIMCDKSKDANLILISFRGTEPFDADDWITDFDYSWYEVPKMGKVHMGFLEALGLGSRRNVNTFQNHLQEATVSDSQQLADGGSKKIISETMEIAAYDAVRSSLKSLLEEHKNSKFVVTGHSLGGALAILFPTMLVFHEEMKVMERLLGVYTFGQPRIGNRQLGRFMKPHLEYPVPKYFRVVYCNDLVPRLPYDDKTFLYKHFGICLYYDSLYVEQKVEEEPNRNYFGIRYLIPEYLNAVWELIRSLLMGYIHGAEYEEGWFSISLRILGLAVPGISAHSPTDYVNSVRLGEERTIQMSSE